MAPMRVFFALIVLAAAGPAAAEPFLAPPPTRTALPPCHSRADCDRRAYDYSGTRGRMGLGADPRHPEGPGNAPN